MGKVDKRTISDNLDVEVTHLDDNKGFSVACTNKNATAPLVIRLNFDNSVNVKVTPAANAKLMTALVVEVTIPPSSSGEAAVLAAVNAEEACSYKYTCATQLKKVAVGAAAGAATATAAPAKTVAPAPAAKTVAAAAPAAAAAAPAAAAAASSPSKVAGAGSKVPVPEGTEETERKSLAEGLEILIHSINNGYNLQIDNAASDNTYTVVLDLESSENLVITAEGSATLDGKKITVSVPPRAIVAVVNMPVADWDVGSCELRYKASIRKH